MRETGRLRQGEAPDCDAVLIDLSKNRSRRYCDTGNCGNRQHVAAYRERLYRDRLAGREPRPEAGREPRPEAGRAG
jgi:predicted RNA-binding Zn ribbon-like protein